MKSKSVGVVTPAVHKFVISRAAKRWIKALAVSFFSYTGVYIVLGFIAFMFGKFEEFKMMFCLISFLGFTSMFLISMIIIVYLVFREVFYDFVEIKEDVYHYNFGELNENIK